MVRAKFAVDKLQPPYFDKVGSSENLNSNLQISPCTQRSPTLYILDHTLNNLHFLNHHIVTEDHMLDWHSCQICCPLEIKLWLL